MNHAVARPCPFSFISKKGGTMRIHFPDEKLKKETFGNQQSVNKPKSVVRISNSRGLDCKILKKNIL